MASRTDPDRAELEKEVVRLKNQKMTERQIAAELGISQSTAHRYLESALDRSVAPEVGELRTASYERLSGILPVLEKQAVKGDQRAAQTVVRIDESIRKLYGLDAPEHIGVVLERRDADMGALVADALTEALGGVVSALHLAPHEDRWRVELEQYGRDLATWTLTERSGPRPVPPQRPAPPEERPVRGELMPPPGRLSAEQRRMAKDPDSPFFNIQAFLEEIVDAEIVDDADDMEPA